MYWILFYDLIDDYLERRAPLRDAHLSLARSLQRRGVLILAGALDEPLDSAALIFKTEDVGLVEQFVRDDPYVQQGLVTSWRIRRWNVVVSYEDDRGFGQSRSGVW